MLELVFDRIIDPIIVNLNDSLSIRGLNLDTDITEVVFIVKRNRSDLDEDAALTKSLLDGIVKIPDPNGDKISITLSHSDFGETGLQSGLSYRWAIGVKTASMSKYLELESSDNTLKVKSDFIRG